MQVRTQFFSPIPPLERSILTGKLNYNEAFESFLRDTHQKQDTSLVIKAFARNLYEKKVSLIKDQPIKVADLGCANSKTCLQYLKSMNFSPGFIYYGVDTNNTFIKQAESNLSNEPLIKQYTLINDDALSGGLKEKEEFKFQSFDFIFISHTAYYLKSKLQCRAFLSDITSMLSERGIAIFLHEDSSHYFRLKYNKSDFNKNSAPMLLEASAKVLNTGFNQYKSIRFTSKLKFLPLTEELWQAAKNPSDYKKYANKPHFVENLEKLAFIVQKDLSVMAEEGVLSDFIDEIKDALIANNNYFDLETHMQTLVAPECQLRHIIAAALTETADTIVDIIPKNYRERDLVLNCAISQRPSFLL